MEEHTRSFPNKEMRQRCYSARDEYWNCLDQHPDKDNAREICIKFRDAFEKSCSALWVSHFDRKYEYLKFKQNLANGFDPSKS